MGAEAAQPMTPSDLHARETAGRLTSPRSGVVRPESARAARLLATALPQFQQYNLEFQLEEFGGDRAEPPP